MVSRSERAPTVTRARLAHVVEQGPLFETQPSLQALQGPLPPRPGAVFVGIGLASGRAVSRVLPIDTLGLLLAAEQVRRAVQAPKLIALVADAHATAHEAPARAVWERARDYEARLLRVGEHCRLGALRVMHASELHAEPGYRNWLSQVARRAPVDTRPYVLREVADIAYLQARHGGLIKVGWALQASARGVLRDERMFDRRFREWVDGSAGFVYAKAGRALSDRRQKMPPYLEWDPAVRICLASGEPVAEKLAWARRHTSVSTYRGVRNHLHAIVRTYGKLVRPVSGSIPEQTQRILSDMFHGTDGAFGADRVAGGA